MTRCRMIIGAVCVLLVTPGCTWWPKKPAGPVAVRVPEPWPVARIVVAPTPTPGPVPLSIETPVPELSYRVPKGLRRPPHLAGNLWVPLKRRWKYIIIHHSATREGSEASFDHHHRVNNGWRGVGYDFVIGNSKGAKDGLVEVTFRWEKQQDGAHAGSKEYNRYGIGICLVGDFEKDYPTAKQMEALVGLINYLQDRCDIPTNRVLFHRHVRPGGTKCPGKNFPFYDLLALLNH